MIPILHEVPGDESGIRAVIMAAFEDVDYSDGNEAKIVDKLREDGALTVSLVADDDTEIVGYCAASPVQIEGAEKKGGAEDWYGIGPVAVHPDYQGHGLGNRLVFNCLRALQGLHDARGAVVLGDPDYYGQFGFTHRDGLEYPGVPAKFFMALRLDGGMEFPTGTVKYHAASGESLG